MAMCLEKKSENFKTMLDDEIEFQIRHKAKMFKIAPTDIRVESIAQRFEVNAATLRRWCYKYLDASPKEYLAQYRLEKAKRMLLQGQRPSEVYKQLGFSEHKVFTTTFKRYVGTTPSQYILDNLRT